MRVLTDYFDENSQQYPEANCIGFIDSVSRVETTFSYSQIRAESMRVACVLKEAELVGKTALLIYPPGTDFVIGFLGCLYAGVIAVPCHTSRSGKNSWARLLAVATDCGADAILSTKQYSEKLGDWFQPSPELCSKTYITTDLAEPRSSGHVFQRPDTESVAYLQYSSGSTGAPKGIKVTHRNLVENAQNSVEPLQIVRSSIVLTWLPMHHDLGLIGNVLQSVFAGAYCILMAPVMFMQSPLRWLQIIEQTRASVTMAPNFAFELCARRLASDRLERLDLTSLEVAINASEPVKFETITKFEEACAPYGYRATTSSVVYGLAEATLIVSATKFSEQPKVIGVDPAELEKGVITRSEGPTAKQLVSCGVPLGDQLVEILEPHSKNAVADNRIGEICVSGSNITKGYWNNASETDQKYIELDAGETPRIFLRTGDLGCLVEGELFVTGRIKEVMIVRGRNHYPQDIEYSVLMADPSFRPSGGAVFSVPSDLGEEVVIVQEIERRQLDGVNLSELARRARNRVFAEHDVAVHDIVFVRPLTVPKTSSGKIQRGLCRQMYTSGTLNPLYTAA